MYKQGCTKENICRAAKIHPDTLNRNLLVLKKMYEDHPELENSKDMLEALDKIVG